MSRPKIVGGNRVNSRVINIGFIEYIMGAPRIAWSMNTSQNHVSGNIVERSCATSNMADVGNVIPEKVKAITAYPPPRDKASRIFAVIVVINTATD